MGTVRPYSIFTNYKHTDMCLILCVITTQTENRRVESEVNKIRYHYGFQFNLILSRVLSIVISSPLSKSFVNLDFTHKGWLLFIDSKLLLLLLLFQYKTFSKFFMAIGYNESILLLEPNSVVQFQQRSERFLVGLIFFPQISS